MKTFGYGLVLVCFAVVVSILMGAASAETWVVDDDDGAADFASIQAAVDEANAGDTIEVRSGTYIENVDVNKRLTLIGDGADVVTVRAEDVSDHVFGVTADYVNISGFTVTGAVLTGGYGIHLDGVDHCNIADNSASNNMCGIYLYSSSNNTLTNNNASNNDLYGISLYSSSNNTLTSNTASNNGNGIYLEYSSINTLTSNTASGNDYGIFVAFSNNNTLTNNTLSNNTWDLYVEGSESTFRENTLGGTTISFTYAGDISLNGVGSPAPDPAGWNTIGKFISATSQSVGAWIFLNFSYSGSDLSGLDESSLKVWKHSGTAWIEDGWNGTRYLDTEDNVIGVNITTFSVFAPAALAAAAYIPPDPVGLANTTGRYWVNHTWSAGTGSVTDSYNVSMYETWTNGTTEAFMNVSVALGGWANITVFAYNASGTGTLSLGSISGNVQAAPPISHVNQTGWWRDGGAFNASVTPIQAAIDSATDGDTICVWNGSYIENVNVDKQVTLQGESADVVTLTAADADANVFNVTEDYVNISGFTVTGATSWLKAGVHLDGADYCNISDINASKNNHGIYLNSSSYNTLVNNTFLDNYKGVYLQSSNNNTITDNIAKSNDGWGILLSDSSNNTLTNNTISENDCNFDIWAWRLSDYVQNIDASNTVDGKPIYYWVNQQNKQIPNDAGHVGVVNSTNITVKDLTLINNGHGVLFVHTSNSRIENVNAANNTYGVLLKSSNDNGLTDNTVVSNNFYGIYLSYSSNNTLSSNTVSDNAWDDLYIENSESDFSNNTLGGTTISFTYEGDVSLKGVGSPAPDPAGWNTIGKFISATNQSAGAWIFLNFSYSGFDLSGLDESSMKVWKHNGTTWVEYGWNKTRYLDTRNDVVGVNITIFSVFAPAALAAAYIPPNPINLANTTGGGWVNYTWSAGTGTVNVNVTDSYNVSMNEEWRNGTTDTFRNVSVGQSGWANITVFAYNASGTGTLSLESISDNVQAPALSTPPGINCTRGNICVNQTGWWRDGGVFNASGTPIQAAIDSATDGDTICVRNGSYSENVDVNKRLTLQGGGADVVTLTAADAYVDVFNVTEEYVNISGFTVKGASWGAGIYLGSDADHCNLSSNTITNNSGGVYLAPDATGNIINFNNIAGNSLYGINNTNVTETVNATCNWWGDVSGPSGAGNGTGDAISANVNYAPWLDSPYPEGKSIYFTNATETTVNETAEIDAREVADTIVTINTTAPVNVTIGNYSRNPGASLEGNITKYIDVHVNNTTNVDRIEIRVYYTDAEIRGLDESSLRMYWWNNSAWVNCSDSGVNITNVGNYSGYVWVNITNTTTPGMGDLNGSVLAPRARKGPPPPPEQRSRGRGTYPPLTPTPTTPTPTLPATPTSAPTPEAPTTPTPPSSVPSTSSPSLTPTSQFPTKPDIPLVIAMVAVVASAVYLILRRRRK